MTEKTAPSLGMKYGYSTGESGWGPGYSANLLAMDALVQLAVISAALATPPGSPADGDRYIVAASPTGAWTGHAKAIAVWLADTSAWRFYTPANGWCAWNRALNTVYRFDGTSWAAEVGGGGGSGVAVKDEGSAVASATALNFVGSGVTATDAGSGVVTVTIPGTALLVAKDEGTTLTSASVMNFVGSGVTATDAGSGVVTVTIPGATSGVAVKDEGSAVATATTLNFVGSGVVATDAGSGTVTVTVSSGGSAITVKDEGVNKTTALASLNFIGPNIVAASDGSGNATVTTNYGLPLLSETVGLGTPSGYNFLGEGVSISFFSGNADITIPGTFTVKEEGTNVSTAVRALNFIGAGVTAAYAGSGVATVTVGAGINDASADGKFYYRKDNTWSLGPQDISLYLPGVQPADSRVARYVFARGVTLPAGLTGSVGKAATAATGAAAMTLKNAAGTALGTVNFAASGTVPTFTFASAVAFVAGDVLDIFSPSSPDATLADIGLTFIGNRT